MPTPTVSINVRTLHDSPRRRSQSFTCPVCNGDAAPAGQKEFTCLGTCPIPFTLPTDAPTSTPKATGRKAARHV
jgi:hypothetical protein